MPSGPWSTAIARVSAMTAPFDVEYTVSPRGRSAEIDETLTMAPPPVRRMAGIACLDARNIVSTFTCMTRRQLSSLSSTTEPRLPMPTLLSRRSRRPKRSRAASTMAAQSRVRVRSASTAMASPGSPAMIFTVCSASASSRSTTTTRAPALASRMAAARPLPMPSPAAPPPVTIATLPASPQSSRVSRFMRYALAYSRRALSDRTFRGEVELAGAQIFAGLLSAERSLHFTALRPLLVHAVHPEREPGAAPFHEADPEPRVFLRHALEEDARELDHLGHRMGERVHFDELVEPVGAEEVRAPHGGVRRDHRSQPLRLRVDRMKLGVAERQTESDRRGERARHSERGDRPAQLLHRLGHVLERQQGHGFQARAHGQELLVNEVVVGPAERDGEVGLAHPSDAEAGRRIEDGRIQATLVHDAEP